jgi:TRAP-type C4-dicarboxylate transport system substrate-binding protein
MKILGAPTTAPYLTPFGATVVPSGLPAMYSQLETGVGDGVIIIHAGAFPLKLYEQAPHVTLVDTGPFTFGASVMNLDVFNSLPSEVQNVLKTLGREYSAANAGVINMLGKKALSVYEAAGCTIREMPDSQRKDMANGMEDLGALFVENLEPKGVPAGDILKKFMKLAGETGQPLRDWSANI